MNCNKNSPSRTVHIQSYSNCSRDSPQDESFNNSSADTSFLPDDDEMAHGSGKSFVEQRIERLYGPGALGMAFRTRRAAIERRNSLNINGEQNDTPENESSKNAFPSVFRHLRPEFRHQLPLKPKRLSQAEFLSSPINGSTNGHTVRHIPIQLEDDVETKHNSNSHSTNIEPISNYSPNLNLVSNRIQSINLSSPKLVRDSVKSNKPDSKIVSCSNNLKQTQSPKSPQPKTEIAHDGKYYLKIVEKEVAKMELNIKRLEGDLESQSEEMNEEVKGKLLATVGKAKLLIKQKILQFRGLCNKNINGSSSDEFPTTNDDLAGFWDMVSIQVDIIGELFNEADIIRKNGWQEIKPISPVKISKQTKNSLKAGGKTHVKKDEKQLKLEEERRKANEVRRKAMREAMMAKKKEVMKDKDVEIFVTTGK